MLKGKREVREGSAATMSSEAMDEAVVDGGRAHSTPKKSNAPNVGKFVYIIVQKIDEEI